MREEDERAGFKTGDKNREGEVEVKLEGDGVRVIWVEAVQCMAFNQKSSAPTQQLYCTALHRTVQHIMLTVQTQTHTRHASAHLYSSTAVILLCMASSRSWGRLVARNTIPSCRSISVRRLGGERGEEEWSVNRERGGGGRRGEKGRTGEGGERGRKEGV